MLIQTIKTISFALALSATLSGGLVAYDDDVDHRHFIQETRGIYSQSEKRSCDSARQRARNLGGTEFSLCVCLWTTRPYDTGKYPMEERPGPTSPTSPRPKRRTDLKNPIRHRTDSYKDGDVHLSFYRVVSCRIRFNN